MLLRSLRCSAATQRGFRFQEPLVLDNDHVSAGEFLLERSSACAAVKLLYFQLGCSVDVDYMICAVHVPPAKPAPFAAGDRDGCWP